MNVAQILSDRAASGGERAAIIDYRCGQPRTLSFRGLEAAAITTAGRLRASGLRPGDSVLVLVPMSAELYIALNAIFRLGLTAMFLDPSAGRSHIEACCAIHSPRAFIGSAQAHWLRFVSAALRRIPLKFSTGRTVPASRQLLSGAIPDGGSSIEPCLSTTPALIRFTSGSTGVPKAAVRTHGFLREQQQVIGRSLELLAGEIDLSTLPIFVLANLAAGVTSIIPNCDLRAPGRIDAKPVVQQFRIHRPNRVSASPALLNRLAEYCAKTRRTLDSLERVVTGGAPVFPHLLDKFNGLAPSADIIAVYGSTEAEPIAQISRNQISVTDRESMWSGRGLLAGFPDPAAAIRILPENGAAMEGAVSDATFRAACLGPGEFGQIVVSGPHVQPGYLHGTGDLETKLNVGGVTWHKTGDAGYLDLHGRVWLLGRSSARIVDRDGTIYPFQVECAAHREPAVRRAALVAHQGQRWLVVEPCPGAPQPDLKVRLAWAGLQRIQFVPRIPVDQRHNTKVDYPALRKML